MTRKSTILRKPEKAPRRRRSVITNQLKLDVLKDYYVTRMTITDICERHTICYETCKRIIVTTEYTPNNFKPNYPNDIYKRVELPPFERMTVLASDTLQALELTIAAIIYRLETELHKTQENPGDKTSTITMKELTEYTKVLAPYVITKKTDKTGKIEESNKPLKKMYEMFKMDYNKPEV